MDLSDLYTRYSRAIRGYLKGLCRDSHLAEDLMQETFLRVQRSLATFDPSKGSFLAWARTIARNLCIRTLQSRSSTLTQTDSEHLEERADSREDPAERYNEKILETSLKNAISCLPEPERSIVLYRYRDNLTLQEMADRLNLSRRTVSRRYNSALELLKRELEGGGLL